MHPADDDNVYRLWDGGSDSNDDVQIDTGVDGWPPFIVEDEAGHRRDLVNRNRKYGFASGAIPPGVARHQPTNRWGNATAPLRTPNRHRRVAPAS